MKPWLIVVDDAPSQERSPGRLNFPALIAEEIRRQRPDAVGVKVVSNALIENSLQDVLDSKREIESPTDELRGVLIDMVEKGNLHAGEGLLQLIKADPVLGGIRCVIFTSKFVLLDSASLKKKGASEVLQRDVLHETLEQFVARILKAFSL